MSNTLNEHYGYLSDRRKCEAYEAAITQLVGPEHAVLDLGCGSGLLGLMALRAGARMVYFVDEGPIIEVARQAVVNAGFSEKARFFQVNSYELELPEKTDVLVCDHVGYFGVDYGILSLLADAQRRLLKPGGIILPREIELKIAIVESSRQRELIRRWRDGNVPADFAWLGAAEANSKSAVTIDTAEQLSASASLARFALGEDFPAFLSLSADLEMQRDGMIDGIAGWFEAQLSDDVAMSNGPDSAGRLKRSQAWFPLEHALKVHKGDRVTATMMIRHEDEIIAWRLDLPESGQSVTQSTFNGLLLNGDSLYRSNPERIATLNSHGKARQLVLSYCNGKRSIAEIEALMLDHHADQFASREALVRLVRTVLQQDTT